MHLRLWCAEQLATALGAGSLSCAPWNRWYAGLLGCAVHPDADLHALEQQVFDAEQRCED